ncbi:hypothetical protein LJ739_15835 [Aestuariibacter halophilus]|uniref:Uncharacterized protein n=1 Tax=Fluctibacter halophilus TaxID=226011 RepID=A0ABS8GB48_9ALTE|nr:hypothetical protein [Aestuariibacter halophilus]MCC2617723.1 hypothetical protein [Aestuariibacter halophilus]
MKKFIVASLSLASLFAHAGEAIVPYWAVTSSETPCFSVSNTSSSPVDIKVTLYDASGNKYTGPLLYPVNISALDQSATLAARSSATFCLQQGSGNYSGHGIVQATNTDPNSSKTFVVAYGRQVYSVSSMRHSAMIPINGGLAF